MKDVGKGAFETFLTEINWCENDIIFTCNNLRKWAKDETPPDIPLMNKAVSPRIRKEPYGVALVIGAYNFPVQLQLGPMIGAIAAGCTCVLKPSELSYNTAAVLQRIIETSLDPSAYACVQGAIPETTALLDQKWDKIFYTGNNVVAKIITKKAAENLTPVALELGGRNASIISKYADIRLAAKRMLWAKLMNAGQVCLSTNYVLIEKDAEATFIAEAKSVLKEFYPKGAKYSPDYGRIVNERHFKRIKKMLDESKGNIVVGGESDEKELFIEPTIVKVTSLDDPILADEIFGPLLGLYAVDSVDEAIRITNQVSGTPLAFYPFSKRQDEIDKMLLETRSGGASVNDGFFHGSIPTLEFGGVGDSGQGSYRGRASFNCFSHRRAVTTTPGWMETLLKVRYPPYSKKKLAQLEGMSKLKPNFDRNGREKSNVLGWLLTLGGLKSLVVASLGKDSAYDNPRVRPAPADHVTEPVSEKEPLKEPIPATNGATNGVEKTPAVAPVTNGVH